jgi:hypothetical protein
MLGRQAAPAAPLVLRLEIKTHAQLHLPFRKRRGKAQRLARRERAAAVQVKRWTDNPYNVINAREVRAVEKVESLRDDLECRLLC